MNISLFLEIKTEYTTHLVDTITPYIYEGLTQIYKAAVKSASEIGSSDHTLIIFQKYLQSINTWSQIRIDEETKRIKQSSNSMDYLDDLVKAVVKTNIIILTYSNNVSNIIAQSFYNNLSTANFIHCCYTECGKDAHNNPYLFFHDVDPMDYKRNQILVNKNIHEGIVRAVRKMLPLSTMLKEYLSNSANIILEPPKIELLGINNTNNQNNNLFQQNPPLYGGLVQDTNMIQQNVSEKRINPDLEKAALKLIKSESVKSNKQIITDIMKLDKALSSMGPKNLLSNNSFKNMSDNNNTNMLMFPPDNLEVDSDNDIINANLDETDKKIININIENEPSVEKSIKNSVSATSISNRALPKKTGLRNNFETSERIDPSKVNLIEDYGNQFGGSKKSKKKIY